MKLNKEAIKAIEELLSGGKSVEIRKRKEEIVILEISAKTKYSMRLNGEA